MLAEAFQPCKKAVPDEALRKRRHGAEEGTRTPTLLTGLDSESSASTNFATSALNSIFIRISSFLKLANTKNTLARLSL